MSDYPDIVNKGRRSVFPERLQLALETFQANLVAGEAHTGLVRLIVDQLADLPVKTLARVEQEMPSRAGLYRGSWDDTEYIPPGKLDLLRRVKGLEYLFLFHRNGYLREAALHKLKGTVPSAFFFAAIAYRLNDWVLPVRQAAFQCVLRIFQETDPEIVTTAAMSLLTRKRFWTRGHSEILVLDEIFSRPGVMKCFVERLTTTDQGTPGRVLTAALSDQRIDPYLPNLTVKARRPAVRAVALHALLKGEARWPEGMEKKWIDKSMGHYRLGAYYKSRPLTVAEPMISLIAAGSLDKVATVRKVAMQALVESPALWNDMQATKHDYAKDRCAAIRVGADYILRRQSESR